MSIREELVNSGHIDKEGQKDKVFTTEESIVFLSL